MRLFIPVTFAALCVLPVVALIWNHVTFPAHLEQRLNESAQYGDLATVNNEASRLTNLYPTYEDKIASYVKNVATPATRIMAAMKNTGETRKPTNSLPKADQALAYDLNDISTGAETPAQ